MESLRRSLLFVPGNNPGMLQNAAVFGADSIIFDLEDSVAVAEKDAARILVRNALERLRFAGVEIVIRINSLSWGEQGLLDVREIAPQRPDCFMLPKAGTSEVRQLSAELDRIEREEGMENGAIGIIALVETAGGILELSQIIEASTRVNGVLLGAEDFTADMGIERTVDGEELIYARSSIAVSCRTRGIDAIDTPYASVHDKSGLIRDAKRAKAMGMTGKAAIHPSQVEVIHDVMMPSPAEVSYARRVVLAMEQAEMQGTGVVSLDGNMIDAPVAERARKILTRAKRGDCYKE